MQIFIYSQIITQCSWSFFFRTWKKEEWINTERNNIQVLKIFKRKRFVDLSRNLSSFRKNAKKNKKYKMKKKKREKSDIKIQSMYQSEIS